ncbi:unnamed protein product, partial [Ectocarpus sp. 6 AP-2014]
AFIALSEDLAETARCTMALVGTVPEISEAEFRKVISKPLIKSSDMPPEIVQEAVEIVTMSVDKFINVKNYEAAAQLIKNSMDKKFGASWHCAIGEGFGFEITYQQRNMIYIFYGQIGVLTFK